MVLEAPPVTPSWAPTRTLTCALVGVLGGFLVGFLMSGYTCRDGLIYNCFPNDEILVGLLTAAGLVIGLLASRIWRSMANTQKAVMASVTVILLAVLVVACVNRFNPWSCPEGADCFTTPGEPFVTT
jgi:hypothetical protein